jgi:hypothetical protein
MFVQRCVCACGGVVHATQNSGEGLIRWHRGHIPGLLSLNHFYSSSANTSACVRACMCVWGGGESATGWYIAQNGFNPVTRGPFRSVEPRSFLFISIIPVRARAFVWGGCRNGGYIAQNSREGLSGSTGATSRSVELESFLFISTNTSAVRVHYVYVCGEELQKQGGTLSSEQRRKV